MSVVLGVNGCSCLGCLDYSGDCVGCVCVGILGMFTWVVFAFFYCGFCYIL